MAIASSESASVKEPVKGAITIDWTAVISIVGVVLLITAAAFQAYMIEISPLKFQYQDIALKTAIIAGMIAPTLAAWLRAVRDGRMAWLPWREPKHDHISGWGVVALGIVVAGIIWLVLWAATSPDNDRTINQSWGFWVVVGLAAAFLFAAIAPAIPRLLQRIGLFGVTSELGKLASNLIRPIGGLLSHIDSILVYAVAGSVGPEQRNVFVRYFLLLGVVGSCAVLGYYLPPALAFLPLAWGFVVTISISRRWIWIEDDRERAMMNPRLARSQTRIGFAQNLRDEALISFMSMFLLVPIALRQAQLLANAYGLDLFSIDPGVDVHDLRQWIGFYGTELAKAVPFVDWAEVYDVSGDATIRAHAPLSLHLIFGTRVLIDLVFLAALLQAISIASRDARQRELFYQKKELSFLDPFSEPPAFRSLVRRGSAGEWETTAAFVTFPRYDLDRLVELAAARDDHVRAAAEKLIERDNVKNDPHFVLSQESAARPLKREALNEAIRAIREAGNVRNVYQLNLTRRRLNALVGAHALRKEVVELIAEAPHSPEKMDALISVLVGDAIDPRAEVREVAIGQLEPRVPVDSRAKATIQHVASHDAASKIRQRAGKILAANPDIA